MLMVTKRVMRAAKKLGLNVNRSSLEGVRLTGYEDENTQAVIILTTILRNAGSSSLAPILPAVFNVKGTPMTLERHFPFEPFFDTQMPSKMLAMAGRQIGKTQSLAARQILQAVSQPHYSLLTVAPLFEMTRRFSTNYVQTLLDESPVNALWVNRKTTKTVLQKSFKNKSNLFYTFAFLNCDRVRGLSVSGINYEEVQDLDKDHLPTIVETMSGSIYDPFEMFGGTPKTRDNTIQSLYDDSSQAEFAIQCKTGGCNYWNFPSLKYDLEAMTGPMRDDISPSNPAIICRMCRKPINPKLHGRWVHAYSHLKSEFVGLHMPQHIFPQHYGNPSRWKTLLDKRDGKNNTPTFAYHNEVCGESSDDGAEIITESDLVKACILPWECRVKQALEQVHRYPELFLAIDWGGGGKERTSWTKMAVLGFTPEMKIDVLFGVHSLTPNDEIAEARLALNLLKLFHCRWLVHDYSNAGGARERIIAAAGFPADRIIPISYVSAAIGPLFKYIPATELQRGYYQADKTRTLQLCLNQIRAVNIRFFQYDYKNQEDAGLVRDFLALTGDRRDTSGRNDSYFIVRKKKFSDDFAQAVNIGTLAIYQRTGIWPDLTNLGLEIEEDAMSELYQELAQMPSLDDLY